MTILRAIQVLFLCLGSFGLGMWLLGGAPFFHTSGPVIVQGLGCAAALEFVMRQMKL